MIRPAARIAAALLLFAAAFAAGALPAHDLSVRIDPQTRRLAGRDRIRLDSPQPVTLLLSARFSVDALSVDGRRLRAGSSCAGAVNSRRWTGVWITATRSPTAYR